jgi:DNA-binding response OmpR family regulator
VNGSPCEPDTGINTVEINPRLDRMSPMMSSIVDDVPDLRVLVAEDDPVMRVMYQEVLRDFGYLPICVPDGGEAWEVFQRDHPPLVILDVQMPVADGLEICRRIREHPEGRDTFIVVITGRDGNDILGGVLDVGADDFLAKPVTTEQLHARVTIAGRNIAQRRTQRLAEAALARAQWLAGIGETSLALQHEINNPLTALLGNAALLQTSEYSKEEEREFVETIVEQAKRIGDVVQRLSSLKDPKSVSYVRGARMLDLSPEPEPSERDESK